MTETPASSSTTAPPAQTSAAATTSTTTVTSPTETVDTIMGKSYEESDDDEKSVEAIKPWDEGGPSDCGYSDVVHNTLMSVGEKVHRLIGQPRNSSLSNVQVSVGNWFQELSYATRDILRGENTEEMHQDAVGVVNAVITGGKSLDEEGDAPETPATEA